MKKNHMLNFTFHITNILFPKRIVNYKIKESFVKQESGFTMVELLLYMGIFSILLVVFLQLFGMILSTHQEAQSTSSVDQDGSFILARLTYDIHNSSSVGGSNCTWTTASPAPCTLVLSNNSYAILGGNISVTEGSYTDVLNSINTSITSITFTTLSNSASGSKPSVQISFTLQSNIKRLEAVSQTQTFQTTVATR